MKKFELVAEHKINFLEKTLYRIMACSSFTTVTGNVVKVGDFGGYVEKENNLSHEGNAWIGDDARIYGGAHVDGNAQIRGNALIRGNADHYQCGPIGSREDFTTFFKGKDGGVYVSCGCFYGTMDQFLTKVKNEHGDNIHSKVYYSAANTASLVILGKELEVNK